MTLEEKAKRYDEALEKARNIVNSINVGLIGKNSFEAVFPELKESEDEKVRKELIETIHLAYDCGCSLNKEQRDKYIAYLEKQSEQNVDNRKLYDIVIEELNKYSGNEMSPWALDSTGIQYPLHFAELGVKWQKEQKSTWSEEDTRLLDNCISLIEDIDCTEDEQNWLRGIKDRIVV